jgi:hypothetical protein
MFSKVFATVSVVLAVSAQINAHAIITPALGVTGTAVRADVQRPSTASPCGTVDVASSIDTSTPVVADATGTFTTNATDFNAGADGSRSVTAKVDPTGAGTAFNTDVTVTQNGDANPTTVGTDQIVASLPAGTTCTGGAAGNLCLVQFTTTAGFGNCVVVSQGAATASNATAAAATTAASNATAAAATTNSTTDAATGAATTTTTTTAAGKKHKGKHAKAAAAAAAAGNVAKVNADKAKAGTRAARALLADLEVRGEEALDVVKRGVLSWVWA